MDLFEKTTKESVVFEGKIITVCRDEVLLPNGKTSFREVVAHNGGVCIAPVTADGEFIFVRQFRYPYKEVIFELPAGKLEKGEDPLEAGKRELEEETGCVAGRYVNMGEFYPSPGYCGERIYLFAALDLEETHMHLDEDEFLEVEKIPVERAVSMVMRDEIRDGKTQALVLKVNEMLRNGDLK
ncbi:MAG: NUDIX hydrolase [Clostridia bacterium]|nr:NUDIX hydrolase [Clostridia bacterium]